MVWGGWVIDTGICFLLYYFVSHFSQKVCLPFEVRNVLDNPHCKRIWWDVNWGEPLWPEFKRVCAWKVSSCLLDEKEKQDCTFMWQNKQFMLSLGPDEAENRAVGWHTPDDRWWALRWKRKADRQQLFKHILILVKSFEQKQQLPNVCFEVILSLLGG